MKTALTSKTFAATVLFSLLSGAALAAPADVAGNIAPSLASQPVSRAAVKAEARAAEQARLIPRGQASYPGLAYGPRSTLDRASVKAETRLAMAQGLIPRGEAFSGSEFANTGSAIARADVKAEARFAEQNGLIERGQANLPRN